MKKGIDNVVTGFLIGALAPVIGVFIYYIFTFRTQTSFNGFVDYFRSIHLFVAYVSLACYITNLPLFFLFIRKEKYNAARGILFATIGYTIWVVYEKFLR